MTITVSQHTPGQLRQTIQIHSHQINADLTQAAGGTETGPDPHDCLLYTSDAADE